MLGVCAKSGAYLPLSIYHWLLANQLMGSAASLNESFGRIVAEHRKLIGLSQERLALIAGLDRTFLGRVESGRHSPSLLSLFKIAKALQIAPFELVRELCERVAAKDS